MNDFWPKTKNSRLLTEITVQPWKKATFSAAKRESLSTKSEMRKQSRNSNHETDIVVRARISLWSRISDV